MLSWSPLDVVWSPTGQGGSKEPPGGPRSCCGHTSPGALPPGHPLTWDRSWGPRPCARHFAGGHKGKIISQQPWEVGVTPFYRCGHLEGTALYH